MRPAPSVRCRVAAGGGTAPRFLVQFVLPAEELAGGGVVFELVDLRNQQPGFGRWRTGGVERGAARAKDCWGRGLVLGPALRRAAVEVLIGAGGCGWDPGVCAGIVSTP